MTIAPSRPQGHDLAPTTSSEIAPTRDLAVRHLRGVSSLFSHRDDLRGVHAFADVVEESVRWSV